MIIIVPDKRNAPTLAHPLGSRGAHPSHRPLPLPQKMLCGTIKNLNSCCKFAGGYQTVPGGIRGRLLKIFSRAHKKNGADRCVGAFAACGDPFPVVLTKKYA